MVKGTWFDSFWYEGEDPDAEVNTDVCNGQVFSNEELELVLLELGQIEDYMNISEETRMFLAEIMVKAQFGIEINK